MRKLHSTYLLAFLLLGYIHSFANKHLSSNNDVATVLATKSVLYSFIDNMPDDSSVFYKKDAHNTTSNSSTYKIPVGKNYLQNTNAATGVTETVSIPEVNTVAPENFITVWDMSKPHGPLGSSTALRFGITTLPNTPVNYSWTASNGNSGSGTIPANSTQATIIGLPANELITLSIAPEFTAFNQIEPKRLVNISQWGNVAWKTMENAFLACTYLRVTATDIPNLTGVSSMKGMFYGCAELQTVPNIESWNTENITDMSALFKQAFVFNGNIGSWNTANVTTMEGLFQDAKAFNQNVGNWDTKKVTNMRAMFYQAETFNQDISRWNTISVKNMDFMFGYTYTFNQNIGNWNTANVTNMGYMFQNAKVFNQNLSNWNTASVTDMREMFYRTGRFNQDLGNWQLNASVNMGSMFDESSLDCVNYSATLNGWANNPNTPAGRRLGTLGLQYGNNVTASRTFLTNTKGWIIIGDSPSGQSCGRSQTITVADMVKTYGDIPFVPTATASSGLEVSYISADNSIAEAFRDSADNNKWKLKIKKAGQVNITAKQPGNEIYTPAPDVIFRLTINKAPLNVTADARSKEFGTADPVLTFTTSGLVNGDTPAVIFGTLQRTIGEAMGTYPITQGTLSAANYTISYTGADFTITNATGDFITVWDMTKASTNTRITINITTLPSPNNQVRYFWTAPDGSTGSGTVTTSGNLQITIPANKPTITLHVKPENLAAFSVFNDPRLIDVAQWGTAEWRSMQNAFVQCSNLDVTATDMPDLSRVTNMRSMFADCSSLTGPANIGSWNTSNVTNMIQVFSRATRFNQDISNWDTRNVTTMAYMFRGASAFNQNISGWNTEKVNDMEAMFQFAQAFNQNISSWNTANVTNMSKMFSFALVFNQEIGSWNTSKVTNMEGMFQYAYAFNGNIGNWNTENVTNMGSMFSYTQVFNQNIGNWNTAKVTSMGGMFWNAWVFNQNIGNWNTANVIHMGYMFRESPIFNQDISNWNTANVTNMEEMFRSNPVFNQNIGNWNTANVTTMEAMFQGAQSFNQNIGDWQLNPVVKMTNMLSQSGLDCTNYSATLRGWAANSNTPSGRNLGALYRQYGTSALAARTSLTTTKGWTITGDSPSGTICGRPFVTVWDMSRTSESQSTPTSLHFGITTYQNAPVSYTWTSSGGSSGSGTLTTNNSAQITGLPAGEIITLSIGSEIKAINIAAISSNDKRRLVDIIQWGDVAWSTMENAFNDCVNLNITATDIPDLSAVRSMRNMFRNCQSLTGPANINSWNTANVTDMEGLFYIAVAFNQDISSWNTANVTNMSYMFTIARSFNQNISNWNTANVTDMSYMFNNTNVFNQDISNWSTANVTNMSTMFAYALVFNKDISNWNTSNVTNMSYMFRNAEAFNQNISSWNTAAVTDMTGMFFYAKAFNQPIGNWNTAAVTNMEIMFASAKNFNQDIGNWNTSAVTNMSGMFDSATAFNKPIGNWNITAVTDMHGMFNYASSFNQDLSHWNVSSVLRLGYMFVNATAFNQNIGNWQLNPNVDITNMLSNSGIDCQNYSFTLQGWANNPNTPSGRNLGARGRQYGTNAERARNFLTNTKGWTITDGGPSGQNCGLDQTITATDMVKTYGDAPFVPTATASSGLEVSYVSADNSIAEAFQDIADGNKWKLKIKKAGTTSIRAQQAGNETYNAATDAIFRLTINKAPLTVLANDHSKIYGTADPTLTYEVNGLVNGDTDTVISGNLSRTAGENIGTYDIGQGTLTVNSNYDISFTGADFNITKATLNIVADAKTKTYGSADPALTYTVTGLVNGDDQSIITGALTRVVGEAIGTYAINQGTLAVSGNYDIAYTGADFNITKATLNIVADAKSKAYGTADPALTYTFTGLVNGDTDAVITGNLTRTAGENIGTYAINQGTLAVSGNYDIAYTGADFNITKATLNIVADAKSKAYGTADPVLTYTVTGLANGDDQTVITGELSRIAGENIGTYAINQGTLTVSGNYDIAYTGADFNITKATLNIVADAKSKTYGTADPALTYTVTGLANGDDQTVITGELSRIAGENIGTYAINQGTLAVSGNYDIAYTGADFNITKATLNIVADAKSKTYGTADPALTYTVTGLANGDDQTVITGALTRTTGENIGTYAINQGTLAVSGNYDIAYTGADFNITKATLNIVADAKSKAYGTADPVLTYTVTGLVNGDTQAVLTGSLVRTAGETAGTYPITQGTLNAGNNYDIVYTGADFTIMETLAIADSSQTNVTCYGSSDGSATVSISGGTAPYSYSWSPNGGTAPTAAGLAAGTYTVTVTDANGSAITKVFTITQPQEVVPPVAEEIQEFCRTANPTISNLAIQGTQVKWYASANVTQELPGNTPLVDGTTYYASQTVNGCESPERTLVIVTLNDRLPTPQGAPLQEFEEGATIADLVVTPANVTWYASYNDAVNNTNPLPPTTPLVDGTTYYAVAVADGYCPSLPLAVAANAALGVGKPQKLTFKYYPNPVEDYLNIQCSETIDSIEVYNLMGQMVRKHDDHSAEIRLFLGDLPDGTYAVSVMSNGKKSTVKVVKK